MADPEYLTYFGDRSLILKSHGQSNMTFFKNRFSRKGLFLLDEPENALSPVLRQLVNRRDVQFIIAAHSPLPLAVPEAEIYSFDSSPIRRVCYEDTDYYRIYRDFLNHREKYLDEI